LGGSENLNKGGHIVAMLFSKHCNY